MFVSFIIIFYTYKTKQYYVFTNDDVKDERSRLEWHWLHCLHVVLLRNGAPDHLNHLHGPLLGHVQHGH